MGERELVIRGLHALIGRLHLIRAGVLPWDPVTIDTAEQIADWYEKRRGR